MKLTFFGPFDFDACLAYLGRSNRDPLHRIKGTSIQKLVKVDGQHYLLKVTQAANKTLDIQCLNQNPSSEIGLIILSYVEEWLDLETDLAAFYEHVNDEPIFPAIIQQLHGLRLIKMPDLFETLAWAIIGQQINLTFAYQVKESLTLEYGESLLFEGHPYYLFPSPGSILAASEARLRELKCSRQKILYLKIVAEAILDGSLDKEKLQKMGYEAARKQLMSLKGIGNWTANYVLMRCLGFKQSFPIEDAGLHQAIRKHYGLDHKPTMEEVRMLTQSWTDWQAYRTFYFWQSLSLG